MSYGSAVRSCQISCGSKLGSANPLTARNVIPRLDGEFLAQPLHNGFEYRANFFIDLLARNALGFRLPFRVHCHIDNQQDRVDNRIVRQMVRIQW